MARKLLERSRVLETVRRFLDAPTFEGDEAKTQSARIINGIFGVTLAGAVLFLSVGASGGFRESHTLVNVLSIATIATVFILKLFLNRGFVRPVGILLSLTLWAAFTFALFRFDGIRDSILSGYFLIVIMTSLMLGLRALFFFGLLNSLGVLAAYYAERCGLLVTTLGVQVSLADLAGVLIALNATALLSGVAVRQISKGHARAQHNAWAMREERDRAQRYLDIAGAIILALDAEQRVTLINKAGCTALGYTEKEILGQKWFERFVPEHAREKAKASFAEMIAGNLRAAEYLESPLLACNGQERLIAWHNALLMDENGHITGTLSSGQDITERVKAQRALAAHSQRLEELVLERTRALQEAQESLLRREKLAMLGQLAGGLGHELRNPLGAISNLVYYMRMASPSMDESLRESLDLISEEVDNVTKIVSDLLDFARVRASDRQVVTAQSLVEGTLAHVSVPENVQVVRHLSSDLPCVFCDPRQIEQVLVNLVNNACQAMPEGGDLVLSAAVDGEWVMLSVTDTGHGISPEGMARLFDPLFTTKPRGIGLGLAISKSLVEANDGTIEVTSRAGEGSTFTVYLPVEHP